MLAKPVVFSTTGRRGVSAHDLWCASSHFDALHYSWTKNLLDAVKEHAECRKEEQCPHPPLPLCDACRLAGRALEKTLTFEGLMNWKCEVI